MPKVFAGNVLDILAILLVLIGSVTVFGAVLSDVHWIFDFFGFFLLFGFWGFLVPTLVGFFRWKWYAKFVLPCILAFVYFGMLAPENVPEAQDQEAIKIYQHNIWNQNKNRAALGPGILEHDTDLAVLLEASSAKLDQHLHEVAKAYQNMYADPLRRKRFTRLQIHAQFDIIEIIRKRTKTGAAIYLGRFTFQGKNTHIVIIHLGRPWPFDQPLRQMVQAQEIIDEIKGLDGPMILMGDLNSPPWGRVAKLFERSLGLKVSHTGLQATWPKSIGQITFPRFVGVPIDLVFTRGGLSVHNWSTGPSSGSDHRAVIYEVG